MRPGETHPKLSVGDDAVVDRELERKLGAFHRRRVLLSLALLAPVAVFLLLAFFIPLISVLYNSIRSGDAADILPVTSQELQQWDGASPLGDGFYQAFAGELKAAAVNNRVADLARALNYRLPGYRSLVMRTAREAEDADPATMSRDRFLAIDKRWGETPYLTELKKAGSAFTDFFILAALDLKHGPDGSVQRAPEDRRIYLDYLARTLWMCLVVTLCCLLLGYPLAYLIASTTGRTTRILLMLVMLSFWTSILVRTAAWVIILRQDGLVNGYLTTLGLISSPLDLLYNRFSVYLSMVHVLMPFMILPIYSVMKSIPGNLMRAAASLGAKPRVAFLQVYMPLTLPGLSAGVLFTYILALGFYITPALVGGSGDQMISSLIARFALGEAHWSMAAALAITLLVSASLIYLVFRKIAPLERTMPVR